MPGPRQPAFDDHGFLLVEVSEHISCSQQNGVLNGTEVSRTSSLSLRSTWRVDHGEDPLGGVKAAVAQVRRQCPCRGGPLARALPELERDSYSFGRDPGCELQAVSALVAVDASETKSKSPSRGRFGQTADELDKIQLVG